MKPLTEPLQGFSFWLSGFLFHFNFAKTFVWAEDTTLQINGSTKVRRTLLFLSFSTTYTDDNRTVKSLVVGPLKVTIGWSKK